MKRHFLILSPLIILALFVGCKSDKDGDALPPKLADVPAAKETACQITKAVNQCKGGMGPEVMMMMTMNSQGGNQDQSAMLMAMLMQKKQTIDPIPGPDCAGGAGAKHQGESHSSLSCNDALIQAMMFAKSAEGPDQKKLWWDAEFQRYVEARFKNAVIDFGMGLPINPLQRLQLGQNFQSAINQAGTFTRSGLNPNNVAYVNAALTAYGNGQGQANTATLNGQPTYSNGATLNGQQQAYSGGGATLNQNSGTNFGTNTYAQTNTSGIQSTSLNLGARKPTSTGSGNQTVNANALRAARGYGLSSGGIGRSGQQ